MNFLWLQTWRLGVKSLLLHPLRSLLTVVGIFIGTASVIWLLAIGEGISVKAQEQIQDLGADNIILRSIKPVQDRAAATSRRLTPYGLTQGEYHALQQKSVYSAVSAVLPIREVQRRFHYDGREVDGRLVGCTPEYAEVLRLQIDQGHFITDTEDIGEPNHCVLSAEVAATLFPLENPIGKSILVEQEFYVVVGVLKPRSPTAGIGGSLAAQDFSRDVYTPINTVWKRIGDRVVNFGAGSLEGEILELSQITLRIAGTEQDVRDTAELVTDLIASHHAMDDVRVIVPLELLEQARTTRIMFMVFMGAIAAISLVVGGIGIMNIMLATVTERTREIGIRRALGAKRSDITRQFLIETVVLTVIGGATGMLGGWLCPPIVDKTRELLFEAIPETMAALPDIIREVSPQLVSWSFPLAFGISVAVGIVFGLYPAIRAAAMDPIEALRHE